MATTIILVTDCLENWFDTRKAVFITCYPFCLNYIKLLFTALLSHAQNQPTKLAVTATQLVFCLCGGVTAILILTRHMVEKQDKN